MGCCFSRFVRKSSNLTKEQLALVGENLGDLSDLLPKNPGVEKVQGMLEAALTGGSLETPPETPPADTPPASDSADTSADDDGEKILEQIRARRAAQAS